MSLATDGFSAMMRALPMARRVVSGKAPFWQQLFFPLAKLFPPCNGIAP
jgi:hypothetical protein